MSTAFSTGDVTEEDVWERFTGSSVITGLLPRGSRSIILEDGKRFIIWRADFSPPRTGSIDRDGCKFSLFVENATLSEAGWHAELYLKNMECEILKRVSADGSTKALFSEKILEIDLGGFFQSFDEALEKVYVEGKIVFGDGTEAGNVETLLPYKYLVLPKAKINAFVTETKDSYEIQVVSDSFASFVELDFEDTDVIFSDNYFHLTEKTGYTVAVRKTDIRQGVFRDAEDFAKRLKICSLADTYIDKR